MDEKNWRSKVRIAKQQASPKGSGSKDDEKKQLTVQWIVPRSIVIPPNIKTCMDTKATNSDESNKAWIVELLVESH